jgi:hypothetical protein
MKADLLAAQDCFMSAGKLFCLTVKHSCSIVELLFTLMALSGLPGIFLQDYSATDR